MQKCLCQQQTIGMLLMEQTPDEVFEDEEGMQIMRVLGNNMAFLMNALEGTKATMYAQKMKIKYLHVL